MACPDDPDHPGHQRATFYWDDESVDQVAFCRLTALAFVRPCLNPAVMQEQPPTVPEAWQAYGLRRLPEVGPLSEPAGCASVLANDLEKSN